MTTAQSLAKKITKDLDGLPPKDKAEVLFCIIKDLSTEEFHALMWEHKGLTKLMEKNNLFIQPGL